MLGLLCLVNISLSRLLSLGPVRKYLADVSVNITHTNTTKTALAETPEILHPCVHPILLYNKATPLFTRQWLLRDNSLALKTYGLKQLVYNHQHISV